MGDTNNISEISAGEAAKQYAKLCISKIRMGQNFAHMPALFMWGPPGVGKSDAVKQMAKIIEKETGKNVAVTDIRLLLFSPIDLRGVPVADQNKEFTKWLMPKFFDMDPSSQTINVLFLDELSAAPPSVQAAAYQITLDRAIGEHKLPDNCIVIAAGNRTTDRSIAYKMPMALANRLLHMEVTASFPSWMEWAVEHNVHPYVLGFLTQDNSKLYLEDVPMEHVAFPTPRSWMFVSDLLNTMEEGESVQDYFTLISGCIGVGTTVEFLGWCKYHGQLPNVEDIFTGKNLQKYPATMDALYALIRNMEKYIKKKEHENTEHGMSLNELQNACRYAEKFPADYQSCFYTSISDENSIVIKLMKLQEYRKWLQKK